MGISAVSSFILLKLRYNFHCSHYHCRLVKFIEKVYSCGHYSKGLKNVVLWPRFYSVNKKIIKVVVGLHLIFRDTDALFIILNSFVSSSFHFVNFKN